MTLTAAATKVQKRRAYRRAVEASLSEIYGTPSADAKKVVAAWWKTLLDTADFNQGLFMHSEPINTAADLIHADVIPMSSEVREKYNRIWSGSLDRVLTPRNRIKGNNILG